MEDAKPAGELDDVTGWLGQHAHVLPGDASVLFEGLLHASHAGSVYISEYGVPRSSVGFWRPLRDLHLDDQGIRYRTTFGLRDVASSTSARHPRPRSSLPISCPGVAGALVRAWRSRRMGGLLAPGLRLVPGATAMSPEFKFDLYEELEVSNLASAETINRPTARWRSATTPIQSGRRRMRRASSKSTLLTRFSATRCGAQAMTAPAVPARPALRMRSPPQAPARRRPLLHRRHPARQAPGRKPRRLPRKRGRRHQSLGTALEARSNDCSLASPPWSCGLPRIERASRSWDGRRLTRARATAQKVAVQADRAAWWEGARQAAASAVRTGGLPPEAARLRGQCRCRCCRHDRDW